MAATNDHPKPELEGEPPAKRARADGAESYDNEYLKTLWDSSVIPSLSAFVEIPNVSPIFDTEWATNGLQEKAVNHISQWVTEQNVPGLVHEVITLEGRTSLLFAEVAATEQTDETVLMYGHFDKQPPLTESWEEGLHPYTAVRRGNKLYGRGGADDGYAIYAAVSAIKTLKESGAPHARIVIVVEGCEESGSPDLPTYVEHLRERIGKPSLIVCLDSGCGNYEQLWVTTSLRGMCNGTLEVSTLTEGVHSGLASGIVPSSFRVARALIDRVEDVETGRVTDVLHVDIPDAVVEQTKVSADALGDTVFTEFPFVEGAGPMGTDNTERLLNRTWRPTLSVTGADGFPATAVAGNVLRQYSRLMLSFRLPPTLDSSAARDALKEILEKDPPYNAQVEFKPLKAANGWKSPDVAPWLHESLESASQSVFGKPVCFLGEGGSIPFMGMLGEMFPDAQFMITGVLGPKSNAHGPNEFIELEFARGITACVASVLSAHHAKFCA